MSLKITNDENGRSLAALLLDTYNEYVSYGYPEDPNVYIIRADSSNIKTLEAGKDLLMSGYTPPDDLPRFMGFRLESDDRLGPDEIVFGPETVTINWRGKK